jgi:hypothetical protein
MRCGGIFHARALHHPLDLRDQIAVVIAERLEFVEHRLNPDRRDEGNEYDDGNDGQPEVKPPSPGTKAQHAIENPAQAAGENAAQQ